MRCTKRWFILTVVFCVAAALQASDTWDKARAVAEKAEASAVRVRVVSELKIDMRGQNVEREQKSEIDGTVIDPCGMTIVSATALDPSELISRAMRGAKVEMAVKETTLILADGTEVPAEVVMKDTELDMAFVRPKEAGKIYAAVSLKPRATQPKPLEDVFVIGRLGKNANRACYVDTGKVRAYVKGPRPYYICSREVSDGTGSVVYTVDGEPLGVVLVLKAPAEDGGGQGGMTIAMGGGGNMAIVRPVEDIIDAAKQALETKPAAEMKPTTEPNAADTNM